MQFVVRAAATANASDVCSGKDQQIIIVIIQRSPLLFIVFQTKLHIVPIEPLDVIF